MTCGRLIVAPSIRVLSETHPRKSGFRLRDKARRAASTERTPSGPVVQGYASLKLSVNGNGEFPPILAACHKLADFGGAGVSRNIIISVAYMRLDPDSESEPSFQHHCCPPVLTLRGGLGVFRIGTARFQGCEVKAKHELTPATLVKWMTRVVVEWVKALS